MIVNKIPQLDETINQEFQIKAKISKRKRAAYHLHKKGDYLNKSFNWILKDSYMQPHFHPNNEKIEQINLISGELTIIFFSNNGDINELYNLRLPEQQTIIVPAFQYHTYIVTSEIAITFETMNGVYDQDSWKIFADWAPKEDEIDALCYLKKLKNEIKK